MRQDGTLAKHNTDWAMGRIATIQVTGYQVRSRLRPLIIANKFKPLLMKGPKKASHERDDEA